MRTRGRVAATHQGEKSRGEGTLLEVALFLSLLLQFWMLYRQTIPLSRPHFTVFRGALQTTRLGERKRRSQPSPSPSDAAVTRLAHLDATKMADAKRVLVPIANGSEEIESVAVIDVLRRAGAQVTVASVESTTQVIFFRSVFLFV